MSDTGLHTLAPRGHGSARLTMALKSVAVVVVAIVLGLWLKRVLWDDASLRNSLRDLRNGNKEERLVAAGQLASPPTPAEVSRVVHALIDALHDEDADVRGASVLSLGSAIRQLRSAWNETANARESTEEGLTITASRATLPLLDDRDSQVRYEALRALIAIHVTYVPQPGGPMPKASLLEAVSDQIGSALLARLGDSAFGVRAMAAEALAHLGPALSDTVPPELVAALSDDARQVREKAAWACSNYKEKLIPLVPALFARLEQAQPPLDHALWSCLQNASADGALVPFLRERLASPSPHVRSAAAGMLARAGPDAVTATSDLIKLLSDPYIPKPQPPLFQSLPDPARFAAWALSTLPPTPQIIQALAASLHSAEPERRETAAHYLGELGPVAEPALLALLEAIREAIPRNDAASSLPLALVKIAGERARTDEIIQTLTEALESRNPRLQVAVVQALNRLGPRASGAIPALKRLASESLPVREMAQRAILAIENGTAASVRGRQ